jgi:tetratricopeptide (TPR) repeat protein
LNTLPTPDQLVAYAESRRREGDLAGAEQSARAALAQASLHSPAHLLLAEIAGKRGAHRLATEHALKAAEKMGSQTLQHIGAVTLRLISVGEYETAARLLGKIDPAKLPVPAFLVEFSQQLSLLELHAPALRFLDQAIGLGARDKTLGYIRGNLLKFLGRIEEAAAEYEASLRIDPNFAYSHWALAYLGVDAANAGARAQRIRAALSTTPENHPDLPYLHYALFRELDTVGDTDAAWAALAAGALGKRRQVRYHPEEETQLFAALREACPPGFADVNSNNSPTGQVPVFILGLPRTGTTLLERILGGNPDITLCGELNDFRMQFKWATDHGSLGFIDEVGVERLPSIDFPELGHRYLSHVAWRTEGKGHFSDKHPQNFMLAGPILRALPQAKVLHLRREPMDACFSNLKELFAANSHPYSYSLEDLAAHHRDYSALMAHWHAIAPGRILDVHYEQMVSDPARITQEVMRFLGLPYDEAQIRVESRAAAVSTASSAQVRQPIHSRNVGGWKRYAAQLEPLRALLGEKPA